MENLKFKMMPGTGSIFKNDYKKKETHPDYKGKIKTPNGEIFEIALWVKKGVKGSYFSASVKEPFIKDSPDIEESQDSNDLPF